ncbi:MAG TPA: alpha/beta hydrolase [Kofleriaceae bacterium]|nr:alpha/beta hydrolase [Kofleriaceae bacterium]
MPARLHHERIARSDTAPVQWLAMTHGIYGAGSNWRSIARKLNERRPDWGVVLVDLRQHGRSEPGEPPHTLAACAEDLRALFAELGDVAAVAGHSFGGKVALSTRRILDLRQTWVLDASPSARRGAPGTPTAPPTGGTVLRVLDFMERAPRHWATREGFVAAVVGEGHDVGLARWLAMSLVPDPGGDPGGPGGGLVLRFDLAALRAMLADYFATDLWDVLEAPGGDVEVVVAERSATVSAADRGRLAAAPPHVHVHYVAADHWLHIDAPDAVVELFVARLP